MMASKRQIKINRKKKEEIKETPVEIKEVTLEEALEEMDENVEEKWQVEPVIEEPTPVSTVVENEISDVNQIGWTRSQLKWEIVWNWTRTVVQQPRWRIKFEAQLAAVPLFKLPDDIRRYLVSHGLPTTVWQWDKEKLEKHKVDMKMVEKLKQFLSNMW